jgi:hypothetical protein
MIMTLIAALVVVPSVPARAEGIARGAVQGALVGLTIGGIIGVVTLLAKGRFPVEVEPSAIDFADVRLQRPASRIVTLRNKTDHGITVESVGINGEGFALAPMPERSVEIKPRQSFDVTVTFSPAAARKSSGRLEIRLNDPLRHRQPKIALRLSARGVI